MNGSWQIFVSETTPDTLGNGVRFHYNPLTNKLFYRNPEDGAWTEVPDIDLSIYLTKSEAASTYLTESAADSLYLTIADAGTTYLTQVDAASTYATQTELQSYLTSADATSIYLSQSDASNIYAALDSPDFTGTVTLPETTSIGSITSEEIGRLSGASSNIQEQLDKKVETTVVSSSADISLENGNILYADTTDGTFTVTLPTNPSAGDSVTIIDTQKSFGRNPLHVQAVASDGDSQATSFTVTNNGSSSYSINGLENPTIELVRGETYTFNINASGHPFYIQTTTGSGFNSDDTYSDGVVGNGTEIGTLTFTVPELAPDNLYYQCEVHSNMAGQISISTASSGGTAAPIEGYDDKLALNVNGSTVVMMYINGTIGWKVV